MMGWNDELGSGVAKRCHLAPTGLSLTLSLSLSLILTLTLTPTLTLTLTLTVSFSQLSTVSGGRQSRGVG